MDPKTLLHTLWTLEVALHQTDIRADVVRLSELLHPCFRELGRSGREYSRDETLIELAGGLQEHKIWSQDYRLEQLTADLALLTYRSAYVTTSGLVERHALRASLWQLTGAGWQMRFHQGTPTEAFSMSDT